MHLPVRVLEPMKWVNSVVSIVRTDEKAMAKWAKFSGRLGEAPS
jgi:hypothetical protein